MIYDLDLKMECKNVPVDIQMRLLPVLASVSVGKGIKKPIWIVEDTISADCRFEFYVATCCDIEVQIAKTKDGCYEFVINSSKLTTSFTI